MADVNEEIAKLYFENNGFLIRTNVKYYVKTKGSVGGDSDIDIIAFNLNPDRMNPPDDFVLKTPALAGIEYAAVEVKGWHTLNFSPSVIQGSPRILNFVRAEADQKVKEVIRTAQYKRILVISSLPTKPDVRAKSIRLLSEGGVDHVIEFKEVIDDMIQSVESNKNYSSEALQMIRLFKVYGKLS